MMYAHSLLTRLFTGAFIACLAMALLTTSEAQALPCPGYYVCDDGCSGQVATECSLGNCGYAGVFCVACYCRVNSEETACSCGK